MSVVPFIVWYIILLIPGDNHGDKEYLELKEWLGRVDAWTLFTLFYSLLRLIPAALLSYSIIGMLYLVRRLKEMNFIKSRKVLIIHLVYSLADSLAALIGCGLAVAYVILWIRDEINEDSKKTEEESEQILAELLLYVLFVSQIYQMCHQISQLVLVYYVQKSIRLTDE